MITRIKELRKHLGLTANAFGSRIGVTCAAVSNIENGRSNPSDQLIRSICREFGANEQWIRTGTGEMFRAMSKEESIATFLKDVLNDAEGSVRRNIVSGLAKLDTKDWENIAAIIRKFREENREG